MPVLILAAVVVACGATTVAKAGTVFIDDYADDLKRGRFVMEAENYSKRLSRNDSGWWLVDHFNGRFIDGPSAGMIAPEDTGGSREDYVEMLGAFMRTDPTSE